MTREEARARATEFVFVSLNFGEIMRRCELAGIPTHTKNGRRIDRSVLELKLIEHYAKAWSEEEEVNGA